METRLASWLQDSAEGDTAERILRACVHCGFCLATCPTYQVLGDELDSPRGRIYQIKQVLEDVPPTRATQVHLDRCLTCCSCETTCPSGVEYRHLVDIGRAAVDARVSRPIPERILRWMLKESISRPHLFAGAVRLGRAMRWMLPSSLRRKLGNLRPAGRWPPREHPRKVLLMPVCAQQALAPSIETATARVFDAIGIQTIRVAGAGCCGALHYHLSDHGGALERIRRNIDAWWPYLAQGGVEAIVISASGCGAMVKDYAHLLRDDVRYAEKARHIVERMRDPVEMVHSLARSRLASLPARRARLAFQSPCTLQHGLKIRGEVEKLLRALGAELVPVADAHLCCGSAGTYSLLQSELSQTLRARKLDRLLEGSPEQVLSANIGCITHLQAATATPVRHWIEWVDEVLQRHPPAAPEPPAPAPDVANG